MEEIKVKFLPMVGKWRKTIIGRMINSIRIQ